MAGSLAGGVGLADAALCVTSADRSLGDDEPLRFRSCGGRLVATDRSGGRAASEPSRAEGPG